jgi:hypothetical protein
MMASAMAIVVALAALGYTLRSATQGPPSAATKAFYTTDEGQTVFVADMSAVPPFEHDGKLAYRVWMYSCDGGKTKFPGYLERYTPEAKKRIEAARAGGGGAASPAPGDVELKKPGAGNPWVSRANSSEAAAVTNVTSPSGSGEPDVVMP